MMLGVGSAKALGGLYGLGVTCPTDADCQIPVTINTNPTVGGPPQCNTAGGYSMQRPSCYQVSQCMTSTDFANAQAYCNAQAAPSAPSQPPAPTSTGPGIINNPISSGNPIAPTTTDLMLGSFDVTSAWSKYGLWVAAGLGGLLLVSTVSK